MTTSVPTGRCVALDVVQVAVPGLLPVNVLARAPVFALQVTVPVGCIGFIPLFPGFGPLTSPVLAGDRGREGHRLPRKRRIRLEVNAPVAVA